MKYLKDNNLLPDHQSASRANHSTKTALLKVLADIILALDSGDLVMMTLLNLSAAFDSVDHCTLLQRLQAFYVLNDVVINWFASHLSSRLQHVRTSESGSSPSAMLYGVPQVSVLGPILFLLYYSGHQHQLHPHAFADDTQFYGSVTHQLLTVFAKGRPPVLMTCRRG